MSLDFYFQIIGHENRNDCDKLSNKSFLRRNISIHHNESIFQLHDNIYGTYKNQVFVSRLYTLNKIKLTKKKSETQQRR